MRSLAAAFGGLIPADFRGGLGCPAAGYLPCCEIGQSWEGTLEASLRNPSSRDFSPRTRIALRVVEAIRKAGGWLDSQAPFRPTAQQTA